METKQSNSSYYLLYKLEKETFAISIESAIEVLQKRKITKVPNSPDYIAGVINFRGEILPIVHTRRRFNMTKQDMNKKFVIVVLDLNLGDDKFMLGAIVDDVKNVVEFHNNNFLSLPEMGERYDKSYLKAMVKYEEEFIMILDPEKTFIFEEVLEHLDAFAFA